MTDPNLAGISRRSRNSTRPAQYWITKADGPKLQEARIERGLSVDKLAAEAGISVRTMTRLEGRQSASCHKATLYRIAATLSDDPDSIYPMLVVVDDGTDARVWPTPASEPPTSWICSRIFPALPAQVAEARAFLGRMLHACPLTDETTIVCSELFTNAVLHSRSALPRGKVTIRVEVRVDEYIWLEVEDQGGRWEPAGNRDDESGRGLIVVAALTDYWDIRTRETRRMACARLDRPKHQNSGGL